MKKLTTAEFIEKARTIHGDLYDYSNTAYIRSSLKVTIHCNKCGRDFEQTPNAHLMGHGCNYCAQFERTKGDILNTEEFIRRAKARHGDRFDYSRVQYKNIKTPVEIVCPEHGPFFTIPDNHLRGRAGCLKCKCDKARSRRTRIGTYDGFSKSSGKCKCVWEDILIRCYEKREQKRHPTYIGCSICEEWMTFSNFEKWFNENYREGYEIEKDILIKGNKVYGPNTCCFVPRRINILLTNRKRFRGRLPIGVTLSESGLRYRASYDRDGKTKLIGYYGTPEEAFLAYKEAKESYIKQVAQEYYDRGEISQIVYDALMRYEVEITD